MFRLTEPSRTHSLNVPVLWFWPDDDSMSRNTSPNFYFLNIDYQYMLCDWRNKFTILHGLLTVVSMAKLYLSSMILTVTCRSNYTQNELLPSYSKKCYANASRCYVTRTLPILFNWKKSINIKAVINDMEL